MIDLSIIIPVYNRPGEVEELLESMTKQTDKNFELLIIEDGSKIKCDHIVKEYKDKINVKYYYKENSGPGQTRNYGIEKATGNYFVFFDSDCIIPEHYVKTIKNKLFNDFVDAYGGPDKAHPSFTNIQKAINYGMTSFFTTGGIRGGDKKLDEFHPRSFNMGFSGQVYDETGGFSKMRFGEDVDLSLRIIEQGFSTSLVPECYVYHKRRTNFKQFFKQVHNSGIARINLHLLHPGSMKAVHFLPSVFTIFVSLFILAAFFVHAFFLLPLIFYGFMVFADSFRVNKSIPVAYFSVPAAYVQLTGYGTGFIRSFYKRIIRKDKEFEAFKKNFYK